MVSKIEKIKTLVEDAYYDIRAKMDADGIIEICDELIKQIKNISDYHEKDTD